MLPVVCTAVVPVRAPVLNSIISTIHTSRYILWVKRFVHVRVYNRKPDCGREGGKAHKIRIAGLFDRDGTAVQRLTCSTPDTRIHRSKDCFINKSLLILPSAMTERSLWPLASASLSTKRDAIFYVSVIPVFTRGTEQS